MKIYVSQTVHSNSLFSVGHVIERWKQWVPKSNSLLYRYPDADIYITAKGGAVYLMSKAETRQPKIGFQSYDAAKLFNLVRALNVGGAA